MRLWRAADVDEPWLGRGSYWTTSEAQAARYVFMQHFGGAGIYTAEVADPPPNVLDLRSDPWRQLRRSTGISEADYDEGILGHDLLQDLIPVFVAKGYEWVAHPVFGHLRSDWRCPPDEWLYVGEKPVVATLDRVMPVVADFEAGGPAED